MKFTTLSTEFQKIVSSKILEAIKEYYPRTIISYFLFELWRKKKYLLPLIHTGTLVALK